MKLYENNIDIETEKIFYTNNIFKTVKQITQNNKDVMFINPMTKIKEVLSFNKDAGLERIVQEKLGETNILNIELIQSIASDINNLLGTNILDVNEDGNRLIKSIFDIEDFYITEQILQNIFNIMENYVDKIPLIVLSGFETKINTRLPYIKIISDFKNQINYGNIEKLVIIENDNVLEIQDKEALWSWLEFKTKSVITEKSLDEYLNGKEDYTSYIIDKAFKSINS